MKLTKIIVLSFFTGTLSLLLTCDIKDHSDNPFDPLNPDYKHPSMTFDSQVISNGDTITKDSIYLVVNGNTVENYFRWRKEDLQDTTAWAAWAGKGEGKYIIILSQIIEGIHVLHIQTAYHWNGDITDTVISFLKVDTPVIIAQCNTTVQTAAAQACTLWVKATGTALLAFQWYKYIVAIPGKTDDTLVFQALAVTDGGSYSCMVSNQWGKSMSSPFSLSVEPMFTVTYNDNNSTSGNIPMDLNRYKEGATAVALDNTGNLIKTGYTFAGWNTAADGSGADYAPGSNFLIGAADVVLYAKWTIVKLNVKFDPQGGSAIDSQIVAYGSNVKKPDDPTRTGYTFGGWFKETVCTNAWNFTSDEVIADVTLYAKWALNQYTVIFESQGGSTVASQTVNHGAYATKPDEPTRTGYTFGGWFKEVTCTNGWNFSTETVNASITLYAKWTIIKYYVSFDSQGGSAVPLQTVNHGDLVTCPQDPTKAGYTFASWFREQGCVNAWVFGTDKVTSDIVLYAKWTDKLYTVTFNSQGGSVVSSQSVKLDSFVLPPKDPTKTGYTFAGWFKERECINAWVFNSEKVTSNVTLYAKWTLNRIRSVNPYRPIFTISNESVSSRRFY